MEACKKANDPIHPGACPPPAAKAKPAVVRTNPAPKPSAPQQKLEAGKSTFTPGAKTLNSVTKPLPEIKKDTKAQQPKLGLVVTPGKDMKATLDSKHKDAKKAAVKDARNFGMNDILNKANADPKNQGGGGFSGPQKKGK
jgi:hypothetical protein